MIFFSPQIANKRGIHVYYVTFAVNCTYKQLTSSIYPDGIAITIHKRFINDHSLVEKLLKKKKREKKRDK